MIQRVHIVEDWPTLGHRVVIRGRPEPGAPVHYLSAEGEWVRVPEAAPIDPGGHNIGFTFPEGALDAIVHEYLKIAAPQQATERHLEDAMAVRDRLLTMAEKQR